MLRFLFLAEELECRVSMCASPLKLMARAWHYLNVLGSISLCVVVAETAERVNADHGQSSVTLLCFTAPQLLFESVIAFEVAQRVDASICCRRRVGVL